MFINTRIPTKNVHLGSYNLNNIIPASLSGLSPTTRLSNPIRNLGAPRTIQSSNCKIAKHSRHGEESCQQESLRDPRKPEVNWGLGNTLAQFGEFVS